LDLVRVTLFSLSESRLLEECLEFRDREQISPPAKEGRRLKPQGSQKLFELRSDLKKEVEGIANREGHSVAQICEAFLLAGSDAYNKQGGKFVKASTRSTPSPSLQLIDVASRWFEPSQ
jgi:hypothetical protein